MRGAAGDGSRGETGGLTDERGAAGDGSRGETGGLTDERGAAGDGSRGETGGLTDLTCTKRLMDRRVAPISPSVRRLTD